MLMQSRRAFLRLAGSAVASVAMSTLLVGCSGGSGSAVLLDPKDVSGTTWYHLSDFVAMNLVFNEDGTASMGLGISTSGNSLETTQKEYLEEIDFTQITFAPLEAMTWEQSGSTVTLSDASGSSTTLELANVDGRTVLDDPSDEDPTHCFYQSFEDARAVAISQLGSED